MDSNTEKKPFYKKWWVWTIAGVLVLGGIGSAMGGGKKPDTGTNDSDLSQGDTPTSVVSTSAPASSTESLPLETSTSDSASSETSETTASVPHRTDEGIVGVSDKDIKGIFATEYDSVNNDVTGRWKCVVIAENDFNAADYALSCYKNYFVSDDTILAVVNLSTKQTASISLVGGFLSVSVYEYVDGEEHDAKLLFSGSHLADYFVYVDNGDIELLSD